MSLLKDNVALITVAVIVIGATAAGLFARNGAKSVIAEIKEEQGRAVADDL